MQCIIGSLAKRTTLVIDDDTLAAAREIAAREEKSIGEVISALARDGMRRIITGRRTRNEIPLLAVVPGAPRVTPELVRQLQEVLL